MTETDKWSKSTTTQSVLKRKKIGAIKKCVYGEAEFLPQHIRTISAVNYLEPTFCGFPHT